MRRAYLFNFSNPLVFLGLLGCFLGLVTGVVVLVADTTPVSAAQTVPYRVNFQGRLTNPSGAIVADGLYNMQFKLYDTSTAGTLLWSETREVANRVQVTNGLFSVQLGSVTALSPTLFSDAAARHLEITMPTPATATCSTASCASWESPMTPRQALASSTYAMNSDLLDGQDGSWYQDASNLNAGTVSAARLSGSYTGITGTGALAAGSIASGFGTIATANTIQGSRFISTVAIGTAPLTVSSATVVTNLNADLLDGQTASFFQDAANLNAGTVGVTRGGTGAGTVGAAGSVAYSTGSAYAFSAAGTSGECLVSGGAATPTWGACGGAGTILQGGNSFTATMTIGTNDAQSLVLETGGAARLTISSTGAATYAGDLTVGTGVGETALKIDGGSTGSQRLSFTTASSTTWSLGAIGGGANPAFQIQRYNAGAYVNSPLSINNSTGATSLTGAVTVTGNFTQASGDFSLMGPGTMDVSAVRVVSSGGGLYLQSGSANAIYFRGANGAVAGTFDTSTSSLTVGGALYASNWLRTYGATGWYSESYGGGWHMSDASWIRSYGSKSVYMDAGFDTGAASAVGCGGGLGAGYSFRVCGSQYVTGTLDTGSHLGVGGYLYLAAPFIENGVSLCRRADNLVTRASTSCWGASTIRLKENVVSLDSSALGLLGQLRPVSFDWKADSKHMATDGGSHDFGLIAEEVASVLPSAVATDADGVIQGITYQSFIPFLIQGIKEQQGQIAALQARDSTMSVLNVTGDATIGGDLNVSGASTVARLVVIGGAEFRGALVAKDAEFNGTLTVNGHIVAKGGVPTITAGQALGAGITAVDGTDSAGTVSFTAGASQATAGVLAHLSFKQAFDTSYKVVLSATNDNAADIKVYIVKTATGFDVVARSPLAAGLQYDFDYIVVGAKTAE